MNRRHKIDALRQAMSGDVSDERQGFITIDYVYKGGEFLITKYEDNTTEAPQASAGFVISLLHGVKLDEGENIDNVRAKFDKIDLHELYKTRGIAPNAEALQKEVAEFLASMRSRAIHCKEYQI